MNDFGKKLREFEKDKYKKSDTYMPANDSSESKYALGNKFGFYFEYRKAKEAISMLKFAKVDISKLKILDIGCHRGGWLNQFAVLRGSSKNLYGVDFIESYIKDAKAINPGINYQVADVYDLDSKFKDQFLDFINLIYLMSSIPGQDLRKVVSQISKKLRSGGYLLIFDFLDSPAINATKKLIKRIKYGKVLRSEELRYRLSKKFFNDGVIKDYFRGFRIVKSKKFINFLSPRLCNSLPYPIVEACDLIIPREYYMVLLKKN